MTHFESARAEILGRIARHLGAAPSSPPKPPLESLPPVPEAIVEALPALVARFCERVLEVGGELRCVRDWDAAATAVAEIIAAKDAGRIALSDHPELSRRVPQVVAGAEIVRAPTAAAEQLDCQVGVSTAQWGIADTGTLVLEGDAEAHRLVSLVPKVHVAVVRAQRILPGIAEALDRIRPEGGTALSRCVTFITGPSRTADIELTLVVGVHGPEELHCIVIEGE